jgi:hypothetical protein
MRVVALAVGVAPAVVPRSPASEPNDIERRILYMGRRPL